MKLTPFNVSLMWRWALVCAIVAPSAVDAQPPALETVPQCVGRFCMKVPVAMTRGAESYSMRGVALEEVELKPAPDGHNAEYRRRLERIRALAERRYLPADAYGTILAERSADGLKTVLFNEGSLRSIVTVGALLDAGSAGLWLSIDASEGNVEVASRRVNDIASAYRQRRVDGPASAGAFHLVRGIVAAPFSLAEEAHVVFTSSDKRTLLTFHYETTFEAPSSSFSSRLGSLFDATAALSLGIRPLRMKSRRVAGLRGDELVLHESEGGRRKLSFGWRSPGKPGSGKAPKITIEMESPAPLEAEAFALWDAFLDSIHPAE